jgi:3-deoxy-D-manno-octulosonic-acid transferase
VGLIIYRLFLWLYKTGAVLLSPWNKKAASWLSGRKDILNKIKAALNENKAPLVWMHCASLGEFEQGRPLLETLKKSFPTHKILLTFFSPSGYEIRKDYNGADYIFYLPMDSVSNARQLLDLAKPQLVLWVKYEYWHYYLHEIKRRRIPLLLISGAFREGQVFFKNYGSFHNRMLSCFSHLFVQSEESKKMLGTIGFSENVTVSGDTRFDRVINIAENFQPIPFIDSFIREQQVIVAGSTWEEDEEELDHYANTHPEIKFIIAPHEIDEEHLLDVEKLFQQSIRYSKWKEDTVSSAGISKNVLIIDNIGMLASLYHYATITYVGGGFGDDGVHNVLEAAVYGKPVIFGPVYEKFREAMELEDAEGAFSIENALELEDVLNKLLTNTDECNRAGDASKNYVYSNKGATEKIISFIQENRLLTN